jgi:hypothetical protein
MPIDQDEAAQLSRFDPYWAPHAADFGRGRACAARIVSAPEMQEH